jgi:flagellar basal-body rod protein FlgC
VPDPTISANAQTMSVAVSALKAQQARMRVIAENIANAESTAPTPGGEPYRRQSPVFQTNKVDGANGVKLAMVRQDQTPFRQEYDPGHPAADANGMVKRPNVDTLVEALDMREAQRAYDANLNVIDTARTMDSMTLNILTK